MGTVETNVRGGKLARILTILAAVVFLISTLVWVSDYTGTKEQTTHIQRISETVELNKAKLYGIETRLADITVLEGILRTVEATQKTLEANQRALESNQRTLEKLEKSGHRHTQ